MATGSAVASTTTSSSTASPRSTFKHFRALLLLVAVLFQVVWIGSMAQIQQCKSTTTAQAKQQGSSHHGRAAARVLMGIITHDFKREDWRRNYHRYLYHQVWQDDRVCSLPQFEAMAAANHDDNDDLSCQFVYTFVMGGNPHAPTSMLLNNTTRPMTISTFMGDTAAPDLVDLAPDITLLNSK